MKQLTQEKFLTDEEIKILNTKLKEEEGTRNAIIVGLLFYTGARQCELSALKPEHINGGCVTIFGRKNSNDATLPLPKKFYSQLKKFADSFQGGENMFPYNTSTLRRIWYKFTPNHKKGLHCLRHTFGVKFYNNTTDLHSTKNFLRHKNIQNTMKYLDYVESTKKHKEQIQGMWENDLE